MLSTRTVFRWLYIGFGKWIVCGLIVAYVVHLCFWSNHVHVSDKARRQAQLVGIGRAIESFASDHAGRMPDKLTDLIPEYVGLDDCWIFLEPDERKRLSSKDLNVTSAIKIIDEFGAFVYRDSQSVAAGILVFEDSKQAIRNRGPHGGEGQFVLFSDYHVEQVAPKDAARLKILNGEE